MFYLYINQILPTLLVQVSEAISELARHTCTLDLEYEIPDDPKTDLKLRIAGTFGGTEKNNTIKKTFAPGPGSYELPSSVGILPQYLLTEDNKAAKAA